MYAPALALSLSEGEGLSEAEVSGAEGSRGPTEAQEEKRSADKLRPMAANSRELVLLIFLLDHLTWVRTPRFAVLR